MQDGIFRFPGGTGPSLPLRWAYRCRCWTERSPMSRCLRSRATCGFHRLLRFGSSMPTSWRSSSLCWRFRLWAILIGYRKIYLGGLIVFTLASLGCVLSRSLAGAYGGAHGAGIRRCGRVERQYGADPGLIYPRRYLGRGMGIKTRWSSPFRRLPGPPWPPACCRSLRGHGFSPSICRSACWPSCSLAGALFRRNPVEARGRKFDWTSAVMNAWTFGLLIASIEGYAHGLDARHIVPGAVAALVLGYFFVRRQLHRPYPSSSGRFVSDSHILHVDRHDVGLLVHRTDAGYGVFAFFPAVGLRAQRGRYRFAAHGMAGGDHLRRSAGRSAG